MHVVYLACMGRACKNIHTFPVINIHVTYWDKETRQYPTIYLNFSLAFAAGTSKGCLGVPFRCLKHDSKMPMGLRGYTVRSSLRAAPGD